MQPISSATPAVDAILFSHLRGFSTLLTKKAAQRIVLVSLETAHILLPWIYALLWNGRTNGSAPLEASDARTIHPIGAGIGIIGSGSVD